MTDPPFSPPAVRSSSSPPDGRPDDGEPSTQGRRTTAGVVFDSPTMLDLREAVKTRSTTYIHAQVEAALRQMLTSTGLTPGEKLPTHAELAAFLHVGSPTVARAMRQMADEGRVVAIPAQGTFVLFTPDAGSPPATPHADQPMASEHTEEPVPTGPGGTPGTSPTSAHAGRRELAAATSVVPSRQRGQQSLEQQTGTAVGRRVAEADHVGPTSDEHALYASPTMQRLRRDLRLNTPVPLHHRVYEALRLLITSGEVAPGRWMPTQRSMCTFLSISEMTLRTAMRRLSSEGLIAAVASRGFQVRWPDGSSIERHAPGPQQGRSAAGVRATGTASTPDH